MKAQTLNISLPTELVKIIDERAGKEYRSRSEFIREAIRKELKDTTAWNNIFAQGKKMGEKMNITSEEEATAAAVQAVREVRRAAR